MRALAKFSEMKRSCFYFVFRVLVGLMFIQHGAMKLFGSFGGIDGSGGTVQLMSLFGAAGVIEFFGGLLIILGLFTKWAALFGLLDMVGAYFIAHIKTGWIPILNGGELAVVFFAAFLVIFAYGGGKWALDNIIFKKGVGS